MSVREYVGARYVPIVVGEWDNSKTYEPLMVVTHEGNSYTSRQYVPAGIAITDEKFWVLSANYNAQVEAYRQEVRAFDGRISANATAISAETTRAEGAEQANATAIDAEKTRAEGAENNLQTNITKNTSDICPDVLFIGDSYMEGYSPDGNLNSFAAKVKIKLEQSSNRHAYIVCRGGYSFVNGNWLSLLAAWVDSQTKETLDRIGNIYICGGANDRHNSSTEITDAEKNFFDYCHTKFINARYTVFYIGAGCVGNATQHTDVLNNKFVNVVNTYMYNSVAYGYSFVNGSGIIKFNKYLSSDFFHPNQNGQNWLAANLFSVVNGGNKAFTYGEKFPGITLFNGAPDFQNNGDNYKLASTGSSFKLAVYNPSFSDCAGDNPWYGYDISDCFGRLIFDTSEVSQDWEDHTLEICTLPNEAIYQAPAGNNLNVVRQWPVNIQYQLAPGKLLPTGVSNGTFFTDSGTLMIHGNKVYLNLRLITPLRGTGESAYLKLPISQLMFTYVSKTTLPNIPEQ